MGCSCVSRGGTARDFVGVGGGVRSLRRRLGRCLYPTVSLAAAYRTEVGEDAGRSAGAMRAGRRSGLNEGTFGPAGVGWVGYGDRPLRARGGRFSVCRATCRGQVAVCTSGWEVGCRQCRPCRLCRPAPPTALSLPHSYHAQICLTPSIPFYASKSSSSLPSTSPTPSSPSTMLRSLRPARQTFLVSLHASGCHYQGRTAIRGNLEMPTAQCAHTPPITSLSLSLTL